MSDYIKVEIIEQHIALVTIDRAEALNALNVEVLSQLRAQIQKLAGHEELAAVIITGTGRAFVAGADIKSMSEMTMEQAEAFAQEGHSTFDAIAALPMPVIAAINGFALGGGLELAVSCDLIYASTKAKLGLPEVGLGLIPGFGGTQRLGRRIGFQRARELVFTGKTINAAQALEMGLALELFEPDALMDGVLAVAKEIASKGPRAVRVAKRVMAQGSDTTLAQGLAIEKGSFSELFSTDEPKVGMRAFIDKSAPNFRA